MKARYHVISGGIAASFLVPALGVNSVFFLAASILMDGDHYLDYLYRNGFKDFSVKRMFTFHELLFKAEQGANFLALNIIHTAEFLLLVYVASALTGWIWLRAILWGMLFHMIFDLVYLYRHGRLFKRAFSIIEYLIRQNRMKRQGMCPHSPYHSALKAMSMGHGSSKDEDGEAKQ